MRNLRWALAMGLIGLLGGCGESPPATPPPPVQPPAPRAAAPATPKEPEVKPPPVVYEAKGRRDPFRPPPARVAAKEGFTVASVKLVGILQGREGPMALVEDPAGLGYILKPGDPIADGRVVEIGVDSVTFSVTKTPGQPPTQMVLKLKTDELTKGGER